MSRSSAKVLELGPYRERRAREARAKALAAQNTMLWATPVWMPAIVWWVPLWPIG